MNTDQVIHVISHRPIADLWRFFLGAAGAFGAHAPNWARADLDFGADMGTAETAAANEVERVHGLLELADAQDRKDGDIIPRARFEMGFVGGENLVIRFGSGRTFVELELDEPARVAIGVSCPDREMADPVGAAANAHVRLMAGHRACPLFDPIAGDLGNRVAAAKAQRPSGVPKGESPITT